mmetsp:Transcript_34002/g.106555  ORF Transcript_34002/g.106555 Transcript_34002/m.106555 type:complete len:288 (-) Transcript_34002:87-950(-)
MKERISKHVADRGPNWKTIECNLNLSENAEQFSGKAVMVDCLTLWLTNFFLEEGAFSMPKTDDENVTVSSDTKASELALQKVKQEFDKLVSQWDVTFVFVTNEIGSGVHPEHTMSRAFVDCQGWLNQHVSARADRVVHMVAGQPHMIKQPRPVDVPCFLPLDAEMKIEQASLDQLLSTRRMQMEPEGYFLVSVDRNIHRICAEFYSCILDDQGRVCDLEGNVIPCDADRKVPPVKRFEGRTAKELAVMVFEKWPACPLKSLVHASYLGREFQKAELALIHGFKYEQD